MRREREDESNPLIYGLESVLSITLYPQYLTQSTSPLFYTYVPTLVSGRYAKLESDDLDSPGSEMYFMEW